jgi:hypothetical protein
MEMVMDAVHVLNTREGVNTCIKHERRGEVIMPVDSKLINVTVGILLPVKCTYSRFDQHIEIFNSMLDLVSYTFLHPCKSPNH